MKKIMTLAAMFAAVMMSFSACNPDDTKPQDKPGTEQGGENEDEGNQEEEATAAISIDGDFADNHMYILTNVLNQFGAAVILYPNVLEEIAMEINDDYYLLPSSIHELVILPRRYSPSTEDIDRMIVEINATQITPDEILSDHSYYYSRLHKSLFLTH